uniref:Fanconi-associated nuclease n=1 Tax=Macrostomum lignano TaxID=282301 RepID=A0A1I8FPF3_9PLAT
PALDLTIDGLSLSVPYLRSVFTALEQLRTVASEIAAGARPGDQPEEHRPGDELDRSQAFDKHCRRVGIFRDFKRDYLTALLRCHRERWSCGRITEKHVAAYHSIVACLDALFHCRDWFAFVSSGGRRLRSPGQAGTARCPELWCATALMEALFWYRLRLHLGQPGELYRFSQAEAGLRADGLRRFAKAIGCKVLMRGDWLEPVIVELLTTV